MKKLKQILKTTMLVAPIAMIAACNGANAKYENLATGEKVYIIKDSETGKSIDSVTNEPVMFYVNLETKDTINGETGLIVNNKIIKSAEGTYSLIENEVEETLDSEGDVKIKIDGDEMKIKTDDKKIKIDGNEKKVKYDN
jgi:hypothetical protein